MKDIEINEMVSIGSAQVALDQTMKSQLITQCKEINISAIASKATFDPATQIITFEDLKIGMNIVPN